MSTINRHAPGHIRESFLDLVEGGPQWSNLPAELVRLAGVLWNCTDTLPADACSDLDMPAGSTYGQGAREIRRHHRRAGRR